MHGFYPQYYRHPYRRRPAAARQYHRRPGVNWSHRHQPFVQRTRSREEAVRDFGDRIELYIPCRQGNCDNYEVQLKDYQKQSGTKKIVVTGRQRSPYREYYSQFGARHGVGGQPVTFYENEWLVPDNIIISDITRATTKDGFLKIIFPRRIDAVGKIQSGDYDESKWSKEMDPPVQSSTVRGSGLHNPHIDDDTDESFKIEQNEPSVKTPPPMESPSKSWRPSPKLLEEEQKWTYPADPGIEVEDVDDCCFDEPDSGVRGKSPSIGYWSREKFVYY